MLQTDRKTEQHRKTTPEKEKLQRKQSGEFPAQAALALEAILAGGSWEQLPTGSVLELSHRIGNAALLSLSFLRNTGPEVQTAAMPSGGLDTAPAYFGGGAPQMTEPPDFTAPSPMGDAAPLAV